ncbi:MAG: restriction endonuclease [Luteimonas sp.]|nr:restriction endonuclease [Luteimonas sp.]
MIESAHWIIALAIAVLIGVAGTLYFRLVVMRRDETEAGLAALAAMSWREFIHLVLDALGRRGYSRVFNHEMPSGDNDYTLERGGKHWLLSCKHGSAFVLSGAQVAELANEIRLANAAGGILATQGRIAPEARPAATMQRIELLDGVTLWPELRELLGPQQRASILAGAASKARQRTLLSWLLALVAGIAVFTLMPAPAPNAATGPAQAANTPTDAGKAVEAAAAPIAAPAPGDATTLEKQRSDVADAISTLPMVDRAAWSTQSTLQVYLLDSRGDAFKQICPLLVHYDALASSRVQLTPPPGSELPTRFKQCRSY